MNYIKLRIVQQNKMKKSIFLDVSMTLYIKQLFYLFQTDPNKQNLDEFIEIYKYIIFGETTSLISLRSYHAIEIV